MMMHRQTNPAQKAPEQPNKKMRDKYQVLERISEGNFGTVYKVKELKTGILVLANKKATSMP